jgi:hypothetical protein
MVLKTRPYLVEDTLHDAKTIAEPLDGIWAQFRQHHPVAPLIAAACRRVTRGGMW